jgi:GT2 family glycosyltransferase
VTPELSVVVMGYRNEDTIVQAVRSVLEQADPEHVEVVVVTSGGDASAERVQRAFPEVRTIESPTRLMPGGARNAGAAATSGTFVAFLAADCTAEPGWVAGRLTAHRAGHDVVGAAAVPTGPLNNAGWAYQYLLYAARLPGRAPGELPPFDPGGHGLSLRRSLLEELGPFDEDIRIGEDTIVLRKLARAGIPVWYESSVRTGHPVPTSLAALLRDVAARGARRGRWWDERPARTGRLALAMTCGVRLWQWLHWTWRRVARTSPADRPRLARVLPWAVAGAVVSQAAWAREVRRSAGTPRRSRTGARPAAAGRRRTRRGSRGP